MRASGSDTCNACGTALVHGGHRPRGFRYVSGAGLSLCRACWQHFGGPAAVRLDSWRVGGAHEGWHVVVNNLPTT